VCVCACVRVCVFLRVACLEDDERREQLLDVQVDEARRGDGEHVGAEAQLGGSDGARLEVALRGGVRRVRQRHRARDQLDCPHGVFESREGRRLVRAHALDDAGFDSDELVALALVLAREAAVGRLGERHERGPPLVVLRHEVQVAPDLGLGGRLVEHARLEAD
jgi:hypothetical protein